MARTHAGAGPGGFIDRRFRAGGLPAWINQENSIHHRRVHPPLVPLRPQLDFGRPVSGVVGLAISCAPTGMGGVVSIASTGPVTGYSRNVRW